MGSMLLLALDTSLAVCSVALWHDDGVVACRFEPMARGHAEALVPMIQAVCADAGADLAQVDALAVTLGPGTFTGIRIGLATVRALALTNACPVVGVSTLAVVGKCAALPPGPDPILVVQDARRGAVYVELLDASAAPFAGPRIVDVPDLAAAFPGRPIRLVGSGARMAADRMGPGTAVAAEDILPDAAVLAAMAAGLLTTHGVAAFARPPSPLYLRAPDAKLPTS
jgi:tRNA threonylcarbamoyladenosine biosynthesis protein TsaB